MKITLIIFFLASGCSTPSSPKRPDDCIMDIAHLTDRKQLPIAASFVIDRFLLVEEAINRLNKAVERSKEKKSIISHYEIRYAIDWLKMHIKAAKALRKQFMPILNMHPEAADMPFFQELLKEWDGTIADAEEELKEVSTNLN